MYNRIYPFNYSLNASKNEINRRVYFIKMHNKAIETIKSGQVQLRASPQEGINYYLTKIEELKLEILEFISWCTELEKRQHK
ncbi:hypothetical protein [Sporocytophaga myxococcoides]|nr:hypothetical protein [Sporocytophaga myxococcoides]